MTNQKDTTSVRSDKVTSIVVNGRQKTVSEKELTFDQVVALADNLPSGPNILYTVTYRKANQNKAEGTLVAGDSVKVKDETTFNVTATDKS